MYVVCFCYKKMCGFIKLNLNDWLVVCICELLDELYFLVFCRGSCEVKCL